MPTITEKAVKTVKKIKKKVPSTTIVAPVKKVLPKLPPKVNLTISEALRIDDTQLFVLNTSSRVMPDKKRTDVLVDVMSGGEPSLVIVKDTWLPIDVTENVPREDALKSPVFRKAVQRGMLQIISTEEAEKMLATEDAIDERQRLSLRNSQEVVESAETINDESNPELKVSPQVVELMNRTMTPRDRLASLKNMQDHLTKEDLHYISIKAAKTEQKLMLWLEQKRG